MKVVLEEVLNIVKEAGKALTGREGANHISQKGASDYVTEVDTKVQLFISQALEKSYPEIQFLGEESSDQQVDFSKKVWVLDPVDGTTNLIHDYKHSVISLALFEAGEAELGIIYDPYREELFWARKGEGAFLNGKPIKVSKAKEMSQSLITIGTSPYYVELAEENFEVFKRVFIDAQDIRRSGSAALDLAWVACGRIDGYFERRLKIWDYAAGLLLVQEAGGSAMNYEGNRVHTELMSDIIVGTKEIAQLLLTNYVIK